jgi:UDP-N-acetyl-D-galactosamine dehydrogenase
MTFKEDCPDLRNSKVIDVIRELEEFGCKVYVNDPLAPPQDALHEYGVTLTDLQSIPRGVDAVILAVAHRSYRENIEGILQPLLSEESVVVDVKAVIKASFSQKVWRL